jgi:glycerol uptake facilitator protein
MSEILGTFILLLVLSAIGTNSFADGLNPLSIGALIVAIGASMGGTTGYAINPARDFAPRLAHFLLPIANKGKSDWHYAWIPVIGPIIGGIWGMLTYELLFDKYLDPLFIPTTIVVFAITLWALNKRN